MSTSREPSAGERLGREALGGRARAGSGAASPAAAEPSRSGAASAPPRHLGRWAPPPKLACAGAALLFAGAALLAAHRHRPPPQTEWLAVALWVASVGLFALACRTPRAEIVRRDRLDRRDAAALVTLLVLGAALLLPWLEIYPLEVAGDPPRDSGVLTHLVAKGEARIFQYGFFNGYSYLMPATGVPFYWLFGKSSLAFKGLAAALGMATPLLLYLLARRYLSHSHAAMAAAIMLALPAYLFYGRREPIHAYNPFWMVIVLAAVMKVEEEEAKPRTFALLGLVAGVSVHFHAAGKAAAFVALLLCAGIAMARTAMRRQSLGRLFASGAAAAIGFAVGVGPLLLVSDLPLLFSSGRLNAGAALAPPVVLDRYLRSLRVFFDLPTASWFPTREPLIQTVGLKVLFAIGAVFGFLALPPRLHLTLLVFVLVLPLTNSALTDILNGDHRLSPLFPVIGLLVAAGLAVLERPTVKLRPRSVRVALRAALLIAAAAAAAGPVRAFFTEEQARARDRFSSFLVHEALREIDRNPLLDRARRLCMGGGSWLHQELRLGHYRDGFGFYRSGQVIESTLYEGAPMNEIFVSASCLPFDEGADWDTRSFCSPRRRFVCPGEESPFSELVMHVDRRPQPAIPSGDQETRTDSSDASRSLAGRRAAPARERALRGLMLVDVVGLEREGAVEVTVNDSTFVPHLGAMFDGDTAWPSRSDSVNPLVIDFAFQRPIRLAAVRVFLVGSTYQWVAEARAGERWSRQSVPSDEWSQIDLRPPVETAAVRLELLRLLRDDNVHVSEIELYTTPP